MKVRSLGKLIIVPNHVVRQIPYLDELLLDNKAKNKIFIISDDISPKFLNIIVDHIRNKQKPEILKSSLENEFENNVIEEQLNFLKLGGLSDKLKKLNVSKSKVSKSNILNSPILIPGQWELDKIRVNGRLKMYEELQKLEDLF